MPNWCHNSLYIRGNKKQIEKFKQTAKRESTEDSPESDLSFENFIPTPEHLLEISEKQPSDMGWYTWRNNTWGTKWDVEADLVCDDEEMLEYSFDSAWAPPLQFVLRVSKILKKLSFMIRYEEPGMGFSGLFRARKGFIIEDQYIEDGDFWNEELDK